MAVKRRKSAPKAKAPIRRRRSAMIAAPKRRRSTGTRAKGKFDVMETIAKPAIGYVIGTIAANFSDKIKDLPTFVKPLIPAAGAVITSMFLKENMIAAGMAAAAAQQTITSYSIPLLSDPNFPLADNMYAQLPILADGSVLRDNYGNLMTLQDGNLYPSMDTMYHTNPEQGTYAGSITI
jgi:hypothetical protein